MKRHQQIFEKLSSIPDHEWIEIIDKLTVHVNFKLKGRTIFGAHSEKKLGMKAIDFYIEDAIQKLYEHKWDWQFEKFTLLEQLIRIIDSTISENVRKYKVLQKEKEKAEAKAEIPKSVEFIPTESEKIEWLADKKLIPEEDNSEETLNKFNKILEICSQDDSELEILVLAQQETSDSDEIIKQCGWDKKKLYTLQRKLYRRVRKYAELNNINF